MLIKLNEEELAEQKTLMELSGESMMSFSVVKMLHLLLTMRHMLVGREQDTWMLEFALIHGIPVADIKNIKFTGDGEIRIGDDP